MRGIDMSSPGTSNNFPALAKSVQTWGLAHWTYIAVAIVANIIGAIWHF